MVGRLKKIAVMSVTVLPSRRYASFVTLPPCAMLPTIPPTPMSQRLPALLSEQSEETQLAAVRVHVSGDAKSPHHLPMAFDFREYMQFLMGEYAADRPSNYNASQFFAAQLHFHKRSQTPREEFYAYLRDRRDDWMQLTPRFLGEHILPAMLWNWLLVFTLPIFLLLGMQRRSVAFVCQSWCWQIGGQPIPASYFEQLSFGGRTLAGLGVLVIYLLPLLCFLLRFPLGGGYSYGSFNDTAVDAVYPAAIGVFLGCVIGIHTTMAYDFQANVNRDDIHAVMPDWMRADAELKWEDVLASTRAAMLTTAERSHTVSVLRQHHPEASSWLQSPSAPDGVLIALCDGLKPRSFKCLRRIRNSKLVLSIFGATALGCAVYPNIMNQLHGGSFWGDCDGAPDGIGCPFPVGVLQFGVVLRMMLSFIGALCIMLQLHYTSSFFQNKTHLRTKLLVLLRLSLNAAEGHGSLTDATRTFLSPSAVRAPLLQSKLDGLRRLSVDLPVWDRLYRFIDSFQEVEEWQVQSTLLCYFLLVLFASLGALLGQMRHPGFSTGTLYITAAVIVTFIGGYVMFILWTGISINELPIEMHRMLRRTAMCMRTTAVQAAEAKAETGVTALNSIATFVNDYASEFKFRVLGRPFTLLLVPLTTTTISTAVIAVTTAAISVIVTSVEGLLRK
jgi:hypothetical protein